MLTPRPINRSLTNDRVLVDMQKMLAIHPNAFECLLFKAELDKPEQINHEKDVVGTLEAQEATFSYRSPVLTKAVELPFELSGLSMLAGGDGADVIDVPRQFLLQEMQVPEQSVIWIDELIDSKVKTTLLYVMSAEPIGKNGTAGYKYNMIPFELDPAALTADPDEELPPKQPDTTGKEKLGDIESVFGGFTVT